MSEGLRQVDQVTQQNTANAEAVAAAAEELSSQSEQLQQMIRQFKLKGANVNPSQIIKSVPASPSTTGWGRMEASPAYKEYPPQTALDDTAFGKF